MFKKGKKYDLAGKGKKIELRQAMELAHIVGL